MSTILSSLYQEMILDHAIHPRNYRVMADAQRTAEGHNPLCGDRITIYLKLDHEKVADVSFDGDGCAICKSSSSIMTELITEKSIQEIDQLFHAFHALLTRESSSEQETQLPQKLSIFSGVSEFPMRVKCATLPWHTLHTALEGKSQTVTTE